VVKFKGTLTATPRGGGGTLIPVPSDVAAKLGLKGMPKIQKEMAHSLEEAKKSETRERRLKAAIAQLRV
jgi:hypothetical protein